LCEELKEQTSNIRASLATTPTGRSGHAPTTATWAGIAARGNRAEQSQITLRENLTQRQNQARTPGLDVDLSGITNPLFDTSSAKAIRDRTRQAFESHEMTKEIKWLGIEMKNTDQQKIRICVRNQADVDTAKIHNEWMLSHFPGARMLDDQWYPIRADRVKKDSIWDDANGRFRDDAREKIGLENGITVEKIRFLRAPNPDKAYFSVVMLLSKREDAERMLEQNYMDFDGEVAYMRVYENLPRPKRCFNCHKFENHEASRCPAREPTCSTCAATAHTYRECTATAPKCANCEGSHKANDRGCASIRNA
jgi:hypothetical protein